MMAPNKLNTTGSELKVLEIISKDGNVSVSHLCNKTEFEPSMVRRTIASLDKKGFIRKHRVGMPKEISLSDLKHALTFRDMVLEASHIPFHKYLAGSSLDVLSVICSMNLGTRKLIQHHTNVSESSIARVFLKLKRVGIVQKRESAYVISPAFGILKDFIIEFRHYLNQKLAGEFSQNSVILWERNDEFIIKSDAKKDDGGNFHLTGPSAFGRYGIQLFMINSYHYHSPRAKKIGLEDVIAHSFLIPRSQRTMLPLLLIWKKNEKDIDRERLADTSKKYGTGKFIDSVNNYFNTRGRQKIDEFPEWEELESKAQEYGVTI